MFFIRWCQKELVWSVGQMCVLRKIGSRAALINEGFMFRKVKGVEPYHAKVAETKRILPVKCVFFGDLICLHA